MLGIGVGNSASFCSKFCSVSAKSPFVMEQVPAANEVRQVKLLDATNDDHGGVIVEMSEPMDSEVFVPILRASVSYWKQQVVILIMMSSIVNLSPLFPHHSAHL